LGLVVETLVVIMDRDRKHLLGVILADDIVVKNLAYLLGGRNAVARLHQRGLVLLVDDVHAQFDAFVADEYGRAGDELAHLVLAVAAERAVERILGIAAADLAHLRNQSSPPSCSTGKSWLHFRPPPVDFCNSRLAIGAATERARALAVPAGTRAQALQTRL